MVLRNVSSLLCAPHWQTQKRVPLLRTPLYWRTVSDLQVVMTQILYKSNRYILLRQKKIIILNSQFSTLNYLAKLQQKNKTTKLFYRFSIKTILFILSQTIFYLYISNLHSPNINLLQNTTTPSTKDIRNITIP